MLKNKLTLLRIIAASLVGILLFAYLLLLLPAVQNFLIQRVTSQLSDKLGTEVKVGRVGFSILNRLDIENLLIKHFGMGYDKAHAIANIIETSWRAKHLNQVDRIR